MRISGIAANCWLMPGTDDLTELAVSSLTHDGRGIGFMPGQGRGRAVFVAGALPGQKILCRIEKEKKNYAEARLVRITEDRADSAKPLCPHWQECGGCPLQLMPYPEQLYWKEKIAKDALLRIGGIEPGELEQAWSRPQGSPLLGAFRNKVELAFGGGGELCLGYRNKGSHEVFELRSCALLHPSAQPLIEAAASFARASALPPYMESSGLWRSLVLRRARSLSSPEQRWHGLLLTSPGDTATRKVVAALGKELLNLGLSSFTHEERARADMLVAGEKRILQLGDPEMAMELGSRLFEIDVSSFFQVNSEASELLAEAVRDLDESGGNLLDLYCGVGAPGQLIAHNHDSCLGVELDARAIRHAERNAAAAWLSSCKYQAGNTGRFLQGLAQAAPARKWKIALLDPPRAGLDARALSGLIRLEPQRIIYVSCNPASLARDASRLKSRYRLAAIRLVDLFPHTPHIESASLWLRRD